MSTNANKDVVGQLVDHLNDGRLELLDEILAADYQQDNPSVPGGREGLKALFARLRAAFPDLSGSIEELVAEDDEVVALSRMRGTHQGDLPGISATGRSVDLASMDLYRIRGGRVVERFGRFNELGMLEQLEVAHDLGWPGSRSSGAPST
jgi:predicted ester cyclase